MYNALSNLIFSEEALSYMLWIGKITIHVSKNTNTTEFCDTNIIILIESLLSLKTCFIVYHCMIARGTLLTRNLVRAILINLTFRG